MGPGIDFVDDDGDARQDGEDLLDFGPRRPMSRRWALIGVLALAGVLAAGIALRGGGQQPTATPSSPIATQPSLRAPDSGFAATVPRLSASPLSPALVAGSAVDLDRGGVQALAIVGGDVVALAPGYLARLTDRHGALQVAATSTPGLPVGDPNYADWRLVTDGTHLWLIGLGQLHRVYRVDPATLNLELGSILPRTGLVLAAAALDGHLYLATGAAVYDLAPGATHARRVPGLAGASALAADPSRHRLLLLGWLTGAGSGVRAYLPASGLISPMTPVGFGKGGLVTAAGRIWAGGFGAATGGGAVLERLNPHTLRPAAASPLAGQLGPGAVLTAAGDRVVWVRSGGGGGDLWCVSAATGRAEQHWDLPGAVVSRLGAAYVVSGSAVAQFRLDATCPG